VKLRGFSIVPAAAALLLLTGCGGNVSPGTASVVNGTTITTSQVDELTDAQCAGVALAAKTQQAQAGSRKQVARGALSLLIDTQLNLDFAKFLGLDPNPTSAAQIYSRVDPLIQALPAKDRPVTERVFHRWATARDLMTQVGAIATGQTVTADNEDTILNAGYQKRQSWLKGVKVRTNPIYGPTKDGFPGGGDGSVSQASSSFAKSGAAATEKPTWVADLPANQRCG
jgi:hypothetical protein